MARATIINKFGTLQGWNSITANMLGRDLEGISKVAYNDKVDKKNAYGAGRFPVGREDGNYETEDVTLGLYKEEADALMASLPPGMRIQDIPPFPIVVEYDSPSGVVMKDIIQNFQFKDMGRDVKQGDGSITHEFKGICSHIDWYA